MSKRSAAIVGGFILLWNICRGGIGLLGDADILVQMASGSGWMEHVLVFLLDPPPGATVITIIVGFVMLYVGLKKETIFPRLTKTEDKTRYGEKPTARQIEQEDRLLSLPDCDLEKAARYLIERSEWGHRTKADFQEAISEIRRAAMEGAITIWGKRSLAIKMFPHRFDYSQTRTAIPASYWYRYRLIVDGIDECGRPSDTQMEDYSGRNRPDDWPRYMNLMLNLDQVSRVWPPKKKLPW